MVHCTEYPVGHCFNIAASSAVKLQMYEQLEAIVNSWLLSTLYSILTDRY